VSIQGPWAKYTPVRLARRYLWLGIYLPQIPGPSPQTKGRTATLPCSFVYGERVASTPLRWYPGEKIMAIFGGSQDNNGVKERLLPCYDWPRTGRLPRRTTIART